jgi:hypothetical protein
MMDGVVLGNESMMWKVGQFSRAAHNSCPIKFVRMPELLECGRRNPATSVSEPLDYNSVEAYICLV